MKQIIVYYPSIKFLVKSVSSCKPKDKGLNSNEYVCIFIHSPGHLSDTIATDIHVSTITQCCNPPSNSCITYLLIRFMSRLTTIFTSSCNHSCINHRHAEHEHLVNNRKMHSLYKQLFYKYLHVIYANIKLV